MYVCLVYARHSDSHLLICLRRSQRTSVQKIPSRVFLCVRTGMVSGLQVTMNGESQFDWNGKPLLLATAKAEAIV